MVSENYNEAIELIRKSKYTIALTGAGVSVESGLPDFRSPDGIWSKYDISKYAYLANFYEDPKRIWDFVRELYSSYSDAKPNIGHISLAKMEEMGFLKCIITQNIDNLHQKAGSRCVIEFHGNITHLRCLKCGKVYKREERDPFKWEVPICDCGNPLKPDFIFFGEGIFEDVLNRSFEMAKKCEVFLIIGTSAEVQPASMLPLVAKESGARLIDINLKPSRITLDGYSDYFLRGKFTEIMSKMVKDLEGEK